MRSLKSQQVRHQPHSKSERHSGFTLVEVLVSLSIFIFVSFGIGAVIRNYLISEKNNESRASLNRISQIISNRLNDEGYCTSVIARPPGRRLVHGVNTTFTMDFRSIGVGMMPTALNTPLDGFDVAIRNVFLVNAIRQSTPSGIVFRDTNDTDWHVWRVSIGMSPYVPSDVDGAGAGQPLQDRIIGSILLKVDTADQVIDSCISEQRFREVMCAQNRKIYNPAGVRGSGEAPDANGCVSKDAYSAAAVDGTGSAGPAGGKGPTGLPLPGPQGPPGSPYVYPPGPPPPTPPPLPPPKTSDARVKDDLGSFDYGLSEVLKIRPIWFEYNGLAGTVAGEKHAGVIAQELEKIAPKLVETNLQALRKNEAATQVKSVRYSDFTMMLLRAVQDQQVEIEKLNREVLRRESKCER